MITPTIHSAAREVGLCGSRCGQWNAEVEDAAK